VFEQSRWCAMVMLAQHLAIQLLSAAGVATAVQCNVHLSGQAMT
jgi:hypothetical protein